MSLPIADTIRKLEKYNDSSFPILSVYFNFPLPKKVRQNMIAAEFQTVINRALTREQRELMKQDTQYMEAFLQNYKIAHNERTIALFSGDNQLWEVVHLADFIPNTVRLDHAPYIEPLLKNLEDYRRYLIVLPDREKAKYFMLYDGSIEDQGEVIDKSVPQNVKGRVPEAQYADRNDKIQRHINDHLHRHFQTITEHIQEFIDNRPITGVIIGGHKPLMSQFKKQLPKQLREKVVGEFVSELNINMNEMINKSRQVISRVNNAFNTQQNPYLSVS